MKLLLLCLGCLLPLLCPSNAGILDSGHHKEKAFVYWAYVKSISSCLGESNFYETMRTVERLFGPCFGIGMDRPTRSAGDEPQMSSADNFFNAPKIRMISGEIFSTIKIVSCYFENLNLTITADNKVDGSSIKNQYRDLDIKEDIKTRIIDYIGKCEAKSDVGEFTQYGDKYVNFQKMVQFYRCAENAKVGACIEYDMDHSAALFDLSGLDGALQELSDAEKRWFVVSAYANWDKTGLFEV